MHPRRTRRFHLAVPLVALALLPATAFAHPIDVLRDSNQVYLGNGAAHHDGRSAQITAYLATKTPGTLSLDLPLSVVGIDTTETLHLTGTRHGDEVWWDFDQPLSLTIDDFNWTRHINGRLITRVSDLPAISSPSCGAGPCPYSLYLDGVDRGSWVRVHGTTTPFFEWSEVADVDFELFSGPHRPRLDNLQVARVGRLCKAEDTREFQIDVTLDSDAASGGTLVSLTSDDPSVRVRQQTRVTSGERRASISFEVPNSYAGQFEIGASAGGVQLTREITIGDPLYCLAPHLEFALDDLELDLACRGCLEDLQLSGDGMALGSMFGTDYLRESDGYIVDLKDILPLDVNTLVLGHAGDIAMRASQYPGIAIILERRGLDYDPYAVWDFAPTHVDARGAVFGQTSGEGQGQPAYMVRGKTFIPEYGIDDGQMTQGPRGGVIIGERIHKGETVPFFASPEEVWTNPYLEQVPGEIVARNAAGQFAGNIVSKGAAYAYFAQDDKSKPTLLQHPQGYHAQAMGMDEAGNVVVNLRDKWGKPKGSAIYHEQTGFVPMEHFVGQQQSFIEVDEVVAVNDAFDLTIRGRIDGESAMFGLRNLPFSGQGGL